MKNKKNKYLMLILTYLILKQEFRCKNMTVIDVEGKFNDNSYLIDTRLMNQEKNLAHYVIENDGMRLMIDIGISSISARRMVKRMKDMGIFPIHKIILTHSHWDHMQGVEIIKNAKFEEITKTGLIFSTKEGETKTLSADSILPVYSGNQVEISATGHLRVLLNGHFLR